MNIPTESETKLCGASNACIKRYKCRKKSNSISKCDLKTGKWMHQFFHLVDILLIWKFNLPKDILGMEINTVITGWERDQMRIWQDVRVAMDLLKLDSLLKDTQWSSKDTSYLHIIQWEPAMQFRSGVTPWKRYDSCVSCSRPCATQTHKKQPAHYGESAQNVSFFCFVSLPLVAQGIHSNLSFGTSPFCISYEQPRLLCFSLTIKVTPRSSAGCKCVCLCECVFGREESWY